MNDGFSPDTYLVGGIVFLLAGVIWFFLTGMTVGYAPLQQAGQLLCVTIGVIWIKESRDRR